MTSQNVRRSVGQTDIHSKRLVRGVLITIKSFHAHGQQPCRFIGKEKNVNIRKSSTSTWLVYDTSMGALSCLGILQAIQISWPISISHISTQSCILISKRMREGNWDWLSIFVTFPANKAALRLLIYIPNIGGFTATVIILCSAPPVKFSILMCPTYERKTNYCMAYWLCRKTYGLSSPCSCPVRGHCGVFLGKTLHSDAHMTKSSVKNDWLVPTSQFLTFFEEFFFL